MIELKNISFRYKDAKIEALKDISFKLNEGSIMAVVGPSGGGKSTLLRVISGLEDPYKGFIGIGKKRVFDNISLIPPEKRGVGMVFQDYALFSHMSVGKNIAFGIEYLNKKERQNRVQEMLGLVNLSGYEKRYPHQLSGGQQQRIALARALAPEPKILLLDEPFSNLDTELLEKVRNDLFKIINVSKTTTIMVTHNPKDAEEYADRIIRIENGKMVI